MRIIVLAILFFSVSCTEAPKSDGASGSSDVNQLRRFRVLTGTWEIERINGVDVEMSNPLLLQITPSRISFSTACGPYEWSYRVRLQAGTMATSIKGEPEPRCESQARIPVEYFEVARTISGVERLNVSGPAIRELSGDGRSIRLRSH